MKWKIVKLADYAEIIAGQSPESKFYNQVGDGMPFFQGKADFNTDYPSVRYYCSKPNKIAKPNDILLSVRAPVGPTNICNIEACIGRGLAAIRVGKSLNYKFVYHYFKSIEKKLSASGNGSTFSAITTGDVKAIEIPLPPLETQKRIADILDKADALRQKDQQLLQKYDELAQAIFMDMFGDPVRNEKGWEVKPLGDYIVDIVAGSSYGGEEKVLESDELGVLKISAVTSGIFNPNEFKAVKKSVIQKEVIKVRKGNLLFSRANTRELVGATCIVDKDYDDLFLPDKLWRIDLKAGCNTFYLKFLLSQKSVRYELNKTATGTSGSMLNISMPKLRDLKIIVPPINKQLDFEKRIIKLCSNQSLVGKETAKSESLFQSLLQQAFNGELVNEKAVTEVI